MTRVTRACLLAAILPGAVAAQAQGQSIGGRHSLITRHGFDALARRPDAMLARIVKDAAGP